MANFHLKFNGPGHENYFFRLINRYKIQWDDWKSISLFYILTITENCRKHFFDCYDPVSLMIKPEAVTHPWFTESDLRAIRLAFNLYNGGVPSADQEAAGDRDNLYRKELLFSTPFKIFSDVRIVEYLLEGLRLRFADIIILW